MQTEETWIPRVGDLIRRRNDPEAPEHRVMGVRGGGHQRSVALDAGLTRWWTSDMFELCNPPPPKPVEEEVAVPVREEAMQDAEEESEDL